ncbi:uncharacterized protein Z518_09736 [Rhinocladiella mackenziei CBS 650.93]|uniref:NmrA-like domain-containing protein n=1 Tax=Rhinocladiella mackenziei CBS 650.93 TaxID=1442369 RepID=A0A0D2IBL4_9EURO|nr:uncharacterized protein Z518_09736 [Rhinocladiella mackenziei CBS 650.93]KIX00671.1 hypothetical protein Z518_09736 [Rhinocladiella mackenziei CBS 650.93]
MVSSDKIITVLGATGTQGSSVVKTFLKFPEWKIRAVTRNPSSSKVQALAALSPRIEIVTADTHDVDSLRRAFTNTTAIFAVTDYWAPFFDPEIREKHATGPNPGDSLRRWAYDDEIQQGQNIARAASQVGDRLERFIWSALPSCKEYSKGKYSHIYHFDSKAVVTEYIRDHHPGLANKMSVIFVGFYASNILLSKMMRPVKRKDGSFLIERLCPPEAKHPFIVTGQDTGPFVKALVDLDPGKTLLAYTASLSWAEMAQIWGKALNQQIECRQVTLNEFKNKFPVDGEELLSATYSAEFGFAGRDPAVIEPRDLGFKDRPEEIHEWMKQQDWSAILDTEPHPNV